MKITESANGVVRLGITAEEFREISEAFYVGESPQPAEFEADDGRKTVVFELVPDAT